MMFLEKVFYFGGGGMNLDFLLFYYMCFNLLLSFVIVFRLMYIKKKNYFDWLIDFLVYKCIYMYVKYFKVWIIEKIINLRI